MLFLIEALRVVLKVLLAPVIWLLRWMGILMWVAGAVIALVCHSMPHQIIWAIVLPVIGVSLIAGTNLLSNVNAALWRWVYFRQQFWVARTAPGKPVKEAVDRFWQLHENRTAMVDAAPRPDRTSDLD